MKRVIALLSLLLPLLVAAQTDRKVSPDGVMQYQYSRTFAPSTEDSSLLVVTFVFVNGANPTAISLRQEVQESVLQWKEIPNGTPGHEPIVEFVTANLAPSQTVTWTYAVSTRKGKRPAAPEQAALLIMQPDYGVEKVWLR
jgi:hypothetical protein